MPTPHAFSLIILDDYLVNSGAFRKNLNAFSKHRETLLKGNATPAVPPCVTPIYSPKAKRYLPAGLADLHQRMDDLNSRQDIQERGLTLSFNPDSFAWGYTPIYFQHTCGTQTVVRAYALNRALDTKLMSLVSCAKRECFQATTGIELTKNAVTPSRAGATPANKTATDAVSTLIAEQSGGMLALVPGCFHSVDKPIVLKLPHATGDEPRFAVFGSHDNSVRREAYAKAAERLRAGKGLDPRTKQFKTRSQAIAFVADTYDINYPIT